MTTAASRRGVQGAAPALAATLALAAPNALVAKPAKLAEPSRDDPIFAAIEAHRQAVAERLARTAECNVREDAVAHESEMLAELFETPPTTFAGLVAFFQHLSWRLPGTDKTPVEDMLNMWIHGDWEPDATQWAALMELALRRIAAIA